jgi:hypothetical protein
MSLAQWQALRRPLARGWRWPLASGLGFGFGGAVGIILVGGRPAWRYPLFSQFRIT